MVSGDIDLLLVTGLADTPVDGAELAHGVGDPESFSDGQSSLEDDWLDDDDDDWHMYAVRTLWEFALLRNAYFAPF